MKTTLAALPLMVAAGLVGAAEPDRIQMIAIAQADAQEAFEAHTRAKADAAANLSEADRARLRAELDAARKQISEAGKRIAELSMQLNETSPHAFAFQYLNEPRRALIGVVLDADAQGVKVVGLTPNGPAAKAGIQVGDRLVSIDNKPVAKNASDNFAAVTQARGLFGELEDGQSIPIQVERAGKTLSFAPKAERRAPLEWTQMLGGPLELNLKGLDGLKNLGGLELHGKEFEIAESLAGDHNVEVIIKRDGEGPRMNQQHIEMMRFDQGVNLNLSTINPELGKYFGAERGVLVLETNDKTLPMLRVGDVIQVIDGQPADSVTDVVRAMARKEKGELMTIEVIRNHQRQVLNVPAPEHQQFFLQGEFLDTPKAAPAPLPNPAPAPAAKAPAPIPAPKGMSV